MRLTLDIEVDLDSLYTPQDNDLIVGLARKFLYPLSPEERQSLDSGGQSHNAYIGRVLRLLKQKLGDRARLDELPSRNHCEECPEFDRLIRSEINFDLDDQWLLFFPNSDAKNIYLNYCPICGKDIREEGIKESQRLSK
jgi:hypothetical protein